MKHIGVALGAIIAAAVIMAGPGAAATGDGVAGIKYVVGPYNSDPSGVVSSTANCPNGRVVLGGGHDVGTFDVAVHSHAYSSTSWTVIAVHPSVTDIDQTAKARAFAECGRGFRAAAAKGSRSRDLKATRQTMRARRR